MPIFKFTVVMSVLLSFLCGLLIEMGRQSAPNHSPMFAFTTYDDRDTQPDIYLADLRLRLIYNLTQNQVDDFQPLWAPDGSKLLFTSRTNANHLYIVALPNLEITPLPRFVGFYDPVWTDIGDAVLVTKQEYDESSAFASAAQEIVYRLQPDGEVMRIGQDGPSVTAYRTQNNTPHITQDAHYMVLVNGPGMAVMDIRSQQIIWQTALTLPFDRPAWRP